MNFSTFFTNQARKPEGLFGRIVMRIVFDQGNAFLNNFVSDLMAVQSDDRILEIGAGTGGLINKMARNIDTGFIEGVDFSNEMVSIARKRNQKYIAQGRVKILEGDFDDMPLEKEKYSRACSINTLYFWPAPIRTAQKIADILKPTGRLFLAFEDIGQLQRRKLNQDVFHIYSTDEVRDLLRNAGFSGAVSIVSKRKGNSIFHCAVAEK